MRLATALFSVPAASSPFEETASWDEVTGPSLSAVGLPLVATRDGKNERNISETAELSVLGQDDKRDASALRRRLL